MTNLKMPSHLDCNAIKLANDALESGAQVIHFRFGHSTVRMRVRCDMDTLGGG
jgi:type II secretory ATPase GspE/PulE/Tfp pilus assembly ATPase PilB-like protein